MKVLHDDERIKFDNQMKNMQSVINDLNIIVEELKVDLISKINKYKNMEVL
jgi:hypothetical protein